MQKFDKFFEKEDIDKIIEGIDKIFQNKKSKPEEFDLGFAVLDRYLMTIKNKRWILSKELIDVLKRAFISGHELPWLVRQKLIIELGRIVKKFPHELVNQIELVDVIISIMKDRINNDDDPDNKFNAVKVLGTIGLEFPDRVIPALNKYMKHYERNIRVNAIIALKNIAKKYDKTHVKQILPFFTEVYEKDTEHEFITKLISESIKEITEKMHSDEVFGDFMLTTQVLCPNCNDFFPEGLGVCSHCGKPLPKCIICGEKVDLNKPHELYQCTQCGLWIHQPCLNEWQKNSNNCPHCLSRLELD